MSPMRCGGSSRPGRAFANAPFLDYPNPFRNPSGTTVHYSVAKAGAVEVRISDVAGRLINTIVDQAKPGENFVVWDGVAEGGRPVASRTGGVSLTCFEMISGTDGRLPPTNRLFLDKEPTVPQSAHMVTQATICAVHGPRVPRFDHECDGWLRRSTRGP
jgi:hypothetical protein